MKNSCIFVYRIFKEKEFVDFKKKKKFKGNQFDFKSGFIHLSTYKQIKGTINNYFNSEDQLYIVKFKTSDLKESLRWEVSRNSEIFPHFYGILESKFIIKTQKKNHEF